MKHEKGTSQRKRAKKINPSDFLIDYRILELCIQYSDKHFLIFNRLYAVNEDRKEDIWTPNIQTAFKALTSARLCAAVWNNINDCDETYNYWEPVI